MTGECLCGAVRVTIDAAPDFINDCNCSLCRKSGGAWGYFQTASVTTEGETESYHRTDRPDPAVEIHTCPRCAMTTHWVLTPSFLAQHEGVDRMGVNMRLFKREDLFGVEVRFPDGAAWSGEGEYTYRQEPMVIGPGTEW